MPFIGEIIMFGGNFAPPGWALCDGQILPIANNTALFSILGTTYGGDGRSTFGLPDLRGRVPIHNGPASRLGEKNGQAGVPLSTSQIPSHTHAPRASTSDASSIIPTNNLNAPTVENAYHTAGDADMKTDALQNAGGGQSHNNLQPYTSVNFIIATTGVFPALE